MILSLQIAGGLLVLLAIFHGFFPKYFQWHEDLRSVKLLTREIFYVHHFFVALTVGLMGLLLLSEPHQLHETDLGQKVLLGFSFFWAIRLLIQFFVYSSSHWRGKPFETAVHVVFSVLWSYLTGLFFLAAGSI